MTRQVLNSGMPITEGSWDKSNRLALDSALDRADANFTELYTSSPALPGLAVVNNALTLNGGVIAGMSSVTATLAASQDNYAPTGYAAGTTNRLKLTAASGGSTIAGILAAPDGFEIRIFNQSATDSITFTHQGSSASGNQFNCPGSVSNVLGPLRGCRIEMVSGNWEFQS